MRIRAMMGAAIVAAMLATGAAASDAPKTLVEARAGQPAATTATLRQKQAAKKPPKGSLTLVSYPAPGGATSGYLSPIPADGGKHPAIIWISGGDLSIGDFWSPMPRENDQSAAAFRQKGVVTFYPSMRGLNGNPGNIEGFYGELDDLVAATRWLKAQPGIDPDRVYLGGHSTGGTLVLLASEYAADWAGVFAFGPVRDPRAYGNVAPVPIAANDEAAARLRAPIYWLDSIKVSTYVIEGTGPGNIRELEKLREANANPRVAFLPGGGCNHFSVLRPASEAIADAIVAGMVDALKNDARFAKLCG